MWNISPEAEDDEKLKVINKVVQQLPGLAALRKVSMLESVSLSVGEGMFLRKSDKMEYYDKKGQSMNLQRAFTTVQPEIAKLPFTVQVYAVNWGW